MQQQRTFGDGLDALDHRVQTIAAHRGQKRFEFDFTKEFLDRKSQDISGLATRISRQEYRDQPPNHRRIARTAKLDVTPFFLVPLESWDEPDHALTTEHPILFGLVLFGQLRQGLP